VNRRRVAALVGKEWLDVRRNPGVLVPVAIVSLIALALPFIIAIGIPAWTGDPLGEDADLLRASQRAAGALPVSGGARVQFFLFQQFFLLFLLTPITGAMALAAHSIVGEKQARTLEPLLATPLTTGELMVAKVVAALWPSLAISLVSTAVYIAGIAWLADPGVATAMLNLRTALLVAIVTPAAALVGLQATLIISSRVNDARTAQQAGALLVVPLTIMLVAPFAGATWLTTRLLGLAGIGLFGFWLVLLACSVLLFRRETILTRWR
jgi:ABC-2 type transport system permease protein